MTRFTISQAAELLGISRKTIYKHIGQGKVSAGIDTLGLKYVDAAELHRVYGDFPKPGDRGDKPEKATLETVVAELRALRKDHQAVLEELQALRQQIVDRPLLTHQAEPASHGFSDIIRRMKEESS